MGENIERVDWLDDELPHREDWNHVCLAAGVVQDGKTFLICALPVLDALHLLNLLGRERARALAEEVLRHVG